jgi:hypothetical protein
MGLLDQPDDLQLFRSRIPHSWLSPSAIIAFFEQAQFKRLLGDDLLQRPGFPTKALDLAAGRRARGVARKAPLPASRNSFDQVLIKALGNAFAPTEFGNAVLAAQAVQHDADFLLGRVLLDVARRMSFTIRSDDNFGVPDFWLISAPRWLR